MIKKIIIIGIITLLILSTTPTYALKTQTNSNIIKLAEKTVNSLGYEENNDQSIKIIENTDDIVALKPSDDSINWRTGWIKVNSTGKGLVVMFPLKILRINAPIPTIQYHNFFPFKVMNFVTLLVYNDTNANTTIQILRGKNKGENITLTGHHSILLGMFVSPPINLLRNLLWQGVIDGISPLGRLLGMNKGPIAKIITWILEKTVGYPFINFTKEQRNFLRDLKGIPPRYQGDTPIFDVPQINDLREKIYELWKKDPRYVNNSIPPIILKLRIFGYMMPSQMFWNRRSIRTSLLKFEMPMQLIGYTPFVRWTKEPELRPFVERVQDFIPDIFDQNITLK